MRNALFILLILIVSSCSTLPKMEPENPECRSVFQIRSFGLNWYDVKKIKDKGRVNTSMFPDWWDEWKGIFDGYNRVLFHLGSRSFVGIKYHCLDYRYTEDSKKNDMVAYEKYCLEEKRSILDIDQYGYDYSMPQSLVPEINFEGPLSFSVYERYGENLSSSSSSEESYEQQLDRLVNSMTRPSILPSLYRLSIFGDFNKGKTAFLQILVAGGTESKMKSIAESISFPKR